MPLIALRLIILLASAYLFGLLVAWLFSWFNSDGGDDFNRGNPDTPKPPQPEKALDLKLDLKGKKRLVEVDESYYLEEFDLKSK